MQLLKNKNILVGKDPMTGKLLVAIEGTALSTAIGPDNSVPASVSRCIPPQNVAHARLSIDNNENIVLTNLKPQNVTFADDIRVMSKHIQRESIIELGADHFSVSIAAILTTARRLVTQIKSKTPPIPGTEQSVPLIPSSKSFQISYLEKIWQQYEYDLDLIQAKQKRNNTMRALQGVLSMGGIVVGGIMAILGLQLIGILFSSAALILGIITFFTTKNDTSAEDRKKALERLEDNYLCPNPTCRKSLPSRPYKWIQRNYTSCSYCKARYTI